jgi:hypothetical protein
MKYEDLYKIDRYAYHCLHSKMTEVGMQVRKGDVVVLTEWGRQNLGYKYSDGVVVSNPRKNGSAISVRPNGRKAIGRYWAGFWRKKNIDLLSI